MLDFFTIRQMIQLLHVPICLYDTQGNVLQVLEEGQKQAQIEREAFAHIPWKYDSDSTGEENGSGSADKMTLALPYICVEKNGVAYCLMQTNDADCLLGVGKVRLNVFSDEKESHYAFCEKDEFTAGILILFKVISGQELPREKLWDENIDLGESAREQTAKELFLLREQGTYHKPYAQEVRELESIRRGDLRGLRRSLDAVASGKEGMLATDMTRQCKNEAICTITLASRSAIQGGLNTELALTMADSFIRNIEETLSDPIRIAQAEKEAQVEFCRAVLTGREVGSANPLVAQVQDYVFLHLHEPIRVKDIAENIGVTPNYLSEQFSQLAGVPLKQYIIDEKIADSEQLLRYTDYSLQEISLFCAFSSQSRYSYYFRRKNGITPTQYRKNFRENRSKSKENV